MTIHTLDPADVPAITPDLLDPQPAPAAVEDSILHRADALTPQPVDWLWKHRIACGGLTLIGGAPGSGKSTLALGLIATVSTGGYWPGGEGRAAAGSAILVCEQAALRDTIVPGLIAAGADRSRIGLIVDVPGENGRRPFNLRTDLALLESAIHSLPEVRLIVIDPVNAFAGPDGAREDRLGALLHELAALAAKHQVAIVAMAHPVRGNYLKPNVAALGAVALNAAARTSFLVHPDPSDPRRGLLLTVKNGLAGSRAALAFTIERREIAPRVSGPVAVWERLPFRLTPDQVIGAQAKSRSAKTEARAFLLQLMADKPAMPVPQIEAEARAAGLLPARQPISQCKPLRDARLALRLKVIREGFGQNGRWIWAKEDYKGHVGQREDGARAPAKQPMAEQKQPSKPAAPARASMEKRASMANAASMAM
jgi:AAA domain-containing protein